METDNLSFRLFLSVLRAVVVDRSQFLDLTGLKSSEAVVVNLVVAMIAGFSKSALFQARDAPLPGNQNHSRLSLDQFDSCCEILLHCNCNEESEFLGNFF